MKYSHLAHKKLEQNNEFLCLNFTPDTILYAKIKSLFKTHVNIELKYDHKDEVDCINS